MKRILVLTVLVMATSPLAVSQTPEKKAGQDRPAGEKVALGGAEQAVTARVRQFFDLLRQRDTAALDPFYADDYTFTSEGGALQTKAERFAWLKDNAARLGALDYQDLKVRAYGETAVVTGRVTARAEGAGQGVNQRFTQVWVNQGGTWRMVAGQVTVIRPPQTQQPTQQPSTEKKP